LAELGGSLAREEWRAASGGLKQARRRLEQASSRLEAATEADAAFAGRARGERQRLEQARAARDDAAARLEEARLSVERADGEARRLADRLRSAVLQRAIANAELESARADLLAVEPAPRARSTVADWSTASRSAMNATRPRWPRRSRATSVRGSWTTWTAPPSISTPPAPARSSLP